MTKLFLFAIFIVVFYISSAQKQDENRQQNRLEFGGDFSIMKKMEDYGGVYKINDQPKNGFKIFKENGYSWARLRIFNHPNMKGPVCNDLPYTIELAKKAKSYGFKVLLNFHYSDTWADPGHQIIPDTWKNLSFDILTDSVFSYTKSVVVAMKKAGLMPDMVQIGNEINNGMMWPAGKLWLNEGKANWESLCALLKAGIRGVEAAENNFHIPIMIHAATGGNLKESDNFYKNILQRDVRFDVIGLSYYPWWHGTFEQLEENLNFLSENYSQDLVLVETAYYANGHYPEPAQWVLNVKPFPPTEQDNMIFWLNWRISLRNIQK